MCTAERICLSAGRSPGPPTSYHADRRGANVHTPVKHSIQRFRAVNRFLTLSASPGQEAMVQQSSSSKIQMLFELCKKTLARTEIPPVAPQMIKTLRSSLDVITPSDLGLKVISSDNDRGQNISWPNQLDRISQWARPITYIHIHECNLFTMCIFCLPSSAAIPLHDHPGMTVLSKLLYGSVHVKAYDWADPCRIAHANPSVKLAKLKTDGAVTAPCEPMVLYPKSKGNIHSFNAVTPCAILDVLTPPYNENAGRRCTYYHEHPYCSFSREEDDCNEDSNTEEYVWLSRTGAPDNLYMCEGVYTGPAVSD